MYAGGGPKNSREAASTDASSHGASAGAFQPLPAFSRSNVTFAPYGGSVSSSFLSASPAFVASSVGGRRSDSFTDVNGRSTLPAESSAGMPPTPVTASAGRQVRLSTSSPRSVATGFIPATNGNLEYTASPSTLADCLACSTRCAGICAWKSAGLISPVFSSSRRDNSWHDAETRCDDARGVAGVHALVE